MTRTTVTRVAIAACIVAAISLIIAVISVVQVSDLHAQVRDLTSYTLSCKEFFTSPNGETATFFPCSLNLPPR